MELWFHDHLVDEITDLVINNLDGYDNTIEEYNGVRELYEDRSSFDLIKHIGKMRRDQKSED
jgi:hypothetical protein